MSTGKPFAIAGDPDCAACGCLESRHLKLGPGTGLRPCAGGCSPHCGNFETRSVDVLEEVDHPSHYGGDSPYEAIRIVEAMGWGEGFNKGNALKYLLRAGKKPDQPESRDLRKAAWYLAREIQRLEQPNG